MFAVLYNFFLVFIKKVQLLFSSDAEHSRFSSYGSTLQINTDCFLAVFFLFQKRSTATRLSFLYIRLIEYYNYDVIAFCCIISDNKFTRSCIFSKGDVFSI